MAKQKGTPTSIGKNSPFRNRTIEENHKIFNEMKNGFYNEGIHVLRAKIDMTHPTIKILRFVIIQEQGFEKLQKKQKLKLRIIITDKKYMK